MLFWWAFRGETGAALVAAETPERACELVQWQELMGTPLTALNATELAEGPSAIERLVERGWTVDPIECPGPPPAEGVYHLAQVTAP